MEKELFDWDGWDSYDTFGAIFYEVTLKVQIGSHKPGTKFGSVSIDYSEGTLMLDEHEKYKITLQLGERIAEAT